MTQESQNFFAPIKALVEDLLKERYGAGPRKRIRGHLKTRAKHVEKWMKNNRPWEDQTGTARASLFADIFEDKTGFELIYGYDVPFMIKENKKDYSGFLENMQSGRFSILQPARAYWEHLLDDEIDRILLNG